MPLPVTILVIDDEPSIISGLARLLSRDGCTVETASNGHLALARLQTHRYDVIVCDLRMPELDGPAFYARLRRDNPALCHRMIFLTGDTLNADSIAFLEQCGQPWLHKPANAVDIRRAIAQVLRATAAAQEGQVEGGA